MSWCYFKSIANVRGGRFHPSDSCLLGWWGPEPIPSQNCCSYALNHTLSSRSHQHGPFWILSLFHSLRALGKLEFVWKGPYGNTVSRVGIFMTFHILGLFLYLFFFSLSSIRWSFKGGCPHLPTNLGEGNILSCGFWVKKYFLCFIKWQLLRNCETFPPWFC